MANIEFNTECEKYLSEIHTAYTESKRLFINTEERLPQMKFFPAPLLEHRDAMDHIMRYYDYLKKSKEMPDASDGKKYAEMALGELKNAKAHEIRAYFDTADYACIIIRDEIASVINKLTVKQIESVWEDYKSIKTKVVDASREVAKLRNDRVDNIEFIDQYKVVLDEMFDIFEDFSTRVLPKIKSRKWSKIRCLFGDK